MINVMEDVEYVNGENLRIGDIIKVPGCDELVVVLEVRLYTIYVKNDIFDKFIPLPKFHMKYYRLKDI